MRNPEDRVQPVYTPDPKVTWKRSKLSDPIGLETDIQEIVDKHVREVGRTIAELETVQIIEILSEWADKLAEKDSLTYDEQAFAIKFIRTVQRMGIKTDES